MTGYLAASSLQEALAAMADGAVPLAGGTDLVVGHRQGKRPLPASLVNLDRLGELRGIVEAAAGTTIGALTTHAAIADDPLVRARFTALADASSIVGSVATRSTGTIGGNVMNASPAADTLGPLLCFDAVAVLQSTGGERRVALAELLLGPGRTTARPGELLRHLELADPGRLSGSAYVRLEYRRQMEIAVVGVAAAVQLGADGTVERARIAMTAVAPTVRRVPAAEASLAGTDAGRVSIAAAAASVSSASAPISDVRGSAEYRRAMVAVVARRAIAAALSRARGGEVAIPASDSTFGARA